MGQEDVIARRYAKGLAELARENNAMDRVRRDLTVLADIVDPRSGAAHVPEFMRFLESPVVRLSEKDALAEKVARDAGFGSEVESFLKVLIGHDRVGLMPRIARAFSELVGPLTGVYTAVVHTARPLSDDQSGRLRKVLAASLGADVILRQQVEPGLLAGAKIVVGDKTIDGTVQGKLDRLRRRLTSRGVLDIEALQAEAASPD